MEFPQPMRCEVDDGADDRLQQGELGAYAQCQQHCEEEDRPERRDGQTRHRLRVGDERQTRTCHIQNTHIGTDTSPVW